MWGVENSPWSANSSPSQIVHFLPRICRMIGYGPAGPAWSPRDWLSTSHVISRPRVATRDCTRQGLSAGIGDIQSHGSDSDTCIFVYRELVRVWTPWGVSYVSSILLCYQMSYGQNTYVTLAIHKGHNNVVMARTIIMWHFAETYDMDMEDWYYYIAQRGLAVFCVACVMYSTYLCLGISLLVMMLEFKYNAPFFCIVGSWWILF